MVEYLKEVYRLREFVRNLVIRDLKVRYKRSYLGFLWTMLSPLFLMVILTVVFTRITGGDIPNFPIFLLSALLVWNFFSQSTILSAFSVINNAPIIGKVYLPKIVFPLAQVISNVVHLILSLVSLLIIMLIIGTRIGPAMLFLPVSIVLLILFTLGVCLLVATINVYFRDMANIMEILLTAWFFLTPILYAPQFLSDKMRFILYLNPMFYMVQCFREPIYGSGYGGYIPDGVFLLKSCFVSLLMLVVGLVIFYRNDDSFYFHL